ncbi:hypothetical protein AHMF7605_14510 [Adhaeribacter arboris]|uniref:Cadherin domain-containing protein n=1 Tax=Adhaeribacter arboris TaxID=2072846 RepID=A0A2T2YGM1_9BACT|nr:choice-of-anchor tandem repeat GloVer-containing protein [Adhaeribacter arboris]PSR54632.1 hypothetical protein AHMF7605_14510 [Adhaeribacter arboris]
MNLPLIKSILALYYRGYSFRGPALFYKPNSWHILFLLLTSTFFSISSNVRAQEELIGLMSNGGPQGKGTLFSVKPTGAGYSVLKGFADWGKSPEGSLVKGDDGNFYGLTSLGGTYNYGTIFKVSPAGAVTVLHQFDYNTTGGYPKGSLVKGADGNLYGMTGSGGPGSYGNIFKITPNGTLTVIKNFSYSTDGAKPNGHLIVAKDGNFYGLTYSGGTYGYGTIFKMTPGGTYTVLRSLDYTTDGGNAYGSLVQGKDGNFYGMTYWGGTYKYGTIFKITSTGSFTVLRHLQPADGIYPQGNNLVAATDGNLYGMLPRGGDNYSGTIFKITTKGAFTVIQHLDVKKGTNPLGSLAQSTDGALYGMTYYGGTNGNGTIFKITTSGTLTVLYNFAKSPDGILPAPDGAHPAGDLFRNSDGNFYGLTFEGGKNRFGTIFKITPSGTFTVLNSLNGGSQGNAPYESVVLAKDGAYYGTTSTGGTYNQGTIFKYCGNTYTVLRSLNKNTDGSAPLGSLIQGTDGNFYGMASEGGTNGAGTIFRITPGGSYSVLHHLKTADGINPYGSLTQGKDGNFYGLANGGGTTGAGTIFKITPSGTFTVLWNLTATTDGRYPEGNLVQGPDGNFYGTNSIGGTNNYGTIFEISPTGTFTVLKQLNSLPDGNAPLGSLVLGKDGNFYGTTSSGGSSSYDGAIFKISPSGTYTVLKRLSGATDGETPKGNLVQASDGNFYGLTSKGGKNNAGTLFRITPSGTYTVLKHFNLITDGGAPMGSLIVKKVNPLVANAQSITTSEDTPKAITLTGSGGSPLTYAIRSNPQNGTISGTGANRTYTPKANFTGKDSFTFTVSVGCEVSAPATVTINVTAVNDAPVLAAIGNKTVEKGSTLTFTAKATDPDAGQSKTFSLVGAPGGATIHAVSGVFNWKPSVAGNYSFSVKVTDNGSPALSDQETITVKVINSTGSLVRVNAGGEAAATSLGSFSADTYFSGATSISATTSPIASTTDDILYQNNRRATDVGGSFSYNIPVSNGTYTVKLHFAETFYTTTGQRKFNVKAEGVSWLSNYDIVAAAGGAKVAVVATKNITVADGNVTLLFSSVVDKACVAAIEVLPASGAESDKATTNLIANLYPNPAENSLTIALNTAVEKVEAKITNNTGDVVKTIDQSVENNKLQIEISNLEAGLYQLHVQTPTGVQVYRFVKK